MRLPTLAPVLLLTAVGCTSAGTFTGKGYSQKRFGYEVAYADAAKRALLGLDWQLDNYTFDKTRGYSEKTGEAYVATRAQDLDGDGTISVRETSEEPRYDLKLVSRTHNGVIWAKAHPLAPDEADRALDVIVDNYADSLSGAGLFAQGNLFSVTQLQARNFTTFVREKGTVTLGSAQALAATIEIGEVDRLRQDPAHRSGIVRVVMAKLKYLSPLSDHDIHEQRMRMGRAAPWPLVKTKEGPAFEKVALLVVGYHNTPSYFESGRTELDQLLGRLSFPRATVLSVGEVKPVTLAPQAPP